MTRNDSDPFDDNKKEAASFFSKWMSSENKGEGWDELCLQWCKRKSAAHNDNVNRNCSMFCFKLPVNEKSSNINDKWNPLKGYAVSIITGNNESTSHIDESSNINSIVKSESNELEKKYMLDLGEVWTQAEVKAKQVANDKVIPLYNSTIEQAVALKDSPEAAQLQEYIKTKANGLLSQIYPMPTFKIDGKPNDVAPSPASDEKK